MMFRTRIASPRRASTGWRSLGLWAVLVLMAFPALAGAADRDRDRDRDRNRTAATPQTTDLTVNGTTLLSLASGRMNFDEMARKEAAGAFRGLVPARPRWVEGNESGEESGGPDQPGGPVNNAVTPPPFVPFAASPAPSLAFAGLDDIAMVDSNYIVIPPDVSGAIGPTKVMQGSNNNYRILDKATGAVLQTLGTATFWAAVTLVSERAALTDPRMAYDPYNNCFIAVMQTIGVGGKVLVAVSQTSDPQGAWYQYAFQPSATSQLDYPILGFNKNWIGVTINRYSSSGVGQGVYALAVNYAAARTGTGSSQNFALSTSRFCTSPCLTYSTTQDTLYLVQHISSSGGTYAVDFIAGTVGSAVYTSGATLTRPGGGWTQPSGNIQPQSAPNSGTSACAGSPCPAETQDAYARSAPVWRSNAIWYSQTVGLPSGTLTHTGVQWTKVNSVGVARGAYLDGGRLEDPTATSTNGGKWYDNVHIAVNGAGDMMLAFTQFSSAQHPSAGYAIKYASDAPGTIRDAYIYKSGEDYYHKTFSTATGRNRWGDFSTAQVDPSDDNSLWALQEYAKNRTGTDDGNTGSNSSRWATYWAKVPTVTTFSITASAVGGGTISPSGVVSVVQGANQTFTMAALAGSHLSDVTVDGGSVGTPATYTFTNVQANHTITATYAINTYTITASAGAGGSISPNGATVVNYGGGQAYSIAADPGYHIADVLVDGVSVGAVSNYLFTNVQANHTISASFAIDTFTITASADPNGTITPNGAVVVNSGGSQGFAIAANANYHIADVLVDGVSVGAVTSYTFSNVTANHTIAASFAIDVLTITATAGAGGSISPSGAVNVTSGADQSFSIAADAGYHIADVLVDGVSVGAVTSYTFLGVTTNHTIDASFAIDTWTIVATAGAGGSIAPSGSVVVNNGDSQMFTIIGNVGYVIADVLVDGVSVGAVGVYTFSNVTANHTIDATFAPVGHTITATAGAGGSISPSGAVAVADGADQAFAITPDAGYHIVDVVVDGGSVGAVASYTFFGVTTDHTIDATFAIDTWTITATAGAGGSIAPSGAVVVNNGDNAVFTITPDGGYHILDVLVDGGSVGAVSSYTFNGVVANHTIDASFEADPVAVFTAGLPAPTKLAVAGVLPNPFAHRAELVIGSPKAQTLQVSVWDTKGRRVASLPAQSVQPGYSSIRWDGHGDGGAALAAGVYVVRIDGTREHTSARVTYLP